MVTLGVHGLPKAVCESERQTTCLSISNCDGIVGEAMLVDNHIVKWHLARYSPDDVTAPVGPNCIVATGIAIIPANRLSGSIQYLYV